MMVGSSPVLKRWATKLLIAVAVVAVGSMVGILAITPKQAETEPAAVAAADETRMQRSMVASAARYTGMARHYAAKGAADQRATDAYAARYMSMAERLARRTEGLQRGMAACGARYTAMAEHFYARDSRQRAMDAYAARWTGMAEHYAGTEE